MAYKNWDEVIGEYEGDPYRRLVMIPTILKLLPDIKGKKIVDIGCGNGILIPYLLKLSPKLVVGTDFLPELVDVARKRLPDSVKIYEHDVTKKLNIKEAPFDGCICNFVLNAVEDIESAFKNMYRLLDNNAFLILGVIHPIFLLGRNLLSEPMLKGYKSYFKGLMVIDGYSEKDKYVEFNSYTHPPSAYINAAINAGFRIEKMLEPETPKEVVDANPKYYKKYKDLPVSMYMLMRKE